MGLGVIAAGAFNWCKQLFPASDDKAIVFASDHSSPSSSFIYRDRLGGGAGTARSKVSNCVGIRPGVVAVAKLPASRSLFLRAPAPRPCLAALQAD